MFYRYQTINNLYFNQTLKIVVKGMISGVQTNQYLLGYYHTAFYFLNIWTDPIYPSLMYIKRDLEQLRIHIA